MFETSTFLSIWYWIFTAFFWSLISNWTFGVSIWALDRAKNSDEERALTATLVRGSIARTVRALEHPPLLHWTFQAFVFGALATLAVLRDSEIAQGMLFLAVPMMGLEIWRRRISIRLSKADLSDDALLARVARIRRVKQVVGGISIAAATAFTVTSHLYDIYWKMDW